MITLLLILLLTPEAKRAPAIHIRSAVVECDAGSASLKTRAFDAAITHFQKAIEIEPTYVEAYQGLIAAYERSKHATEMARVVTRLLQLEPDAVAYRLKLAAFLAQSGDSQRALAQYSLALQTDSKNADALAGFIDAAQKAGLTEKGAAAKARAHQLYPSDKRFQ